MDLDWEEGIFRGLVGLGRRLRGPEEAPEGAALLEEHRGALTTLARLVADEPVVIRPGRGAGGVRGPELLLPGFLAVAPDVLTNRALYRLRTTISAAVRKLTRSDAPRRVKGAEEMASLEVASRALDWLGDEFHAFAPAWETARGSLLAGRPAPSDLRGRERLLEEIRRAALAGARPWEDAALVSRLARVRRSRGPRSPEIPLFGAWMPELAAAESSDDASSGKPAEVTSEAAAMEVGELERVEIDRREQEEAVLIHTFEKTETLDEYRGGARDTDGSDNLDDQLEALSEVDLGALVRDPKPTHAALRADIGMEVDVPDARGQETPTGLPYDEWDGRRKRYRSAWCRVHPTPAKPGGAKGAAWAKEAMTRHAGLRRELRQRLERHRAGLRERPRQLDGDDVDLEALVDHHASLRAGHGGDPRLYVKARRQRRDFATTVLLDVSLSTDSWNEGRRVLDVAREAILVLGEVTDELGDRLQVLAFASETRHRCQVWHVKDWHEPWAGARARLGALEPVGYTRIGPALRYATDTLAREPAERRLLLLVSDGKPTDYDRYEGRYGIADVRQALREAARREIHAHALAIDAVAREALPPMFGPGAWHVLPHPGALPEALTTVYGRLTGH